MIPSRGEVEKIASTARLAAALVIPVFFDNCSVSSVLFIHITSFQRPSNPGLKGIVNT